MPTWLQSTHELTAAQREQMFSLMTANFSAVSPARFAADLEEKPWVFLVADGPDAKVEGFSTLMPMTIELAGHRAVALFSGDTVLADARWGDRSFVRCIGLELLRIAARQQADRVYWLLLTCAYRGYRMLPAFFVEYFPRFETAAPAVQGQTIAAIVRSKFGSQYRSQQGVVELAEPTPFLPGRGEVDPRHLADPSVAYFLEANPGYLRGDFLVAWADLSPANLTPFARRLRDAGAPAGRA